MKKGWWGGAKARQGSLHEGLPGKVTRAISPPASPIMRTFGPNFGSFLARAVLHPVSEVEIVGQHDERCTTRTEDAVHR